MGYTDPSRPKPARKRRRKVSAAKAKAAPPSLREWLGHLVVSQGRRAGETLEILGWQDELLAALDGGSQIVACSMGRGGGKTTFAAALALAHVAGPEAQAHGEVVVVAASFSQARICFEHALSFGEQFGIGVDQTAWRVINSSALASIEHRPTGARLRVLGSDPRRLLGIAPSFLLLDEPAAWPSNAAPAMWSALSTSLGKLPGARLVAIGTRPADPEHFFSALLDGQADTSLCYSAASDADPLDEGAWLAANPSLPHFPDLRLAIEREAAQAAKDPSALFAFRALRLNAGSSDVPTASLIDASSWRRVIELPVPEPEGPLVYGVDVGGAAACSVVSAYWPACGRLSVLGAFGCAEISLEERGRLDGVSSLYRECARAGELLEQPDTRIGDVEGLLREAMERFGAPDRIAADRWRISELRDALDAAQVPLTGLVARGQGWRDGGTDTRGFIAACLSDQVRPGRSLLLGASLGEATVLMDPAGNTKLCKRRSRSRDDAAAASVLAVAEGQRMLAGAAPRRRGRFLV